MIEHRKEGLNSVTNLMTGIRELGFQFNETVENQGEKLEEVGKQLEDANANTNKGAQELGIFAQTLKGRGIQLFICMLILLGILGFLVYLILS